MKKILLLGFVVLGFVSIVEAYNVNNYFANPGSGKENTLVIRGTQTVSGTLNVTGIQNNTGTVTFSSITVTNRAQAGTFYDGTASLTGGKATGLLNVTTSSETVTNTITADRVVATTRFTQGSCIIQSSDIACDEIVTTGVAQLGGVDLKYAVLTDSDTITASSGTVILASKNGIMSIAIPTAVGNAGLVFIIKKTGTAGAVTISTNGTETIDGTNDPTYVDAQYDFLGIMSDGTNWVVIDRYIQ